MRDLHSRRPKPPRLQRGAIDYSANPAFKKMEPTEGFEPPTHALQKRCSTTELCRQPIVDFTKPSELRQDPPTVARQPNEKMVK